MQILGLIPARVGSKGIVGKNLIPLAGKPLLAYTCIAAKQSTRLTRIIVSTDDENIACVAVEAGIEVPFLRPSELAQDKTPMMEVIRHMLLQLDQQEGYKPDILVLLQPTSPLRKAEDIDGAVDLLVSSKADTVVSVIEVPHNVLPSSLMQLEGDRLIPMDSSAVLRRQEKRALFSRNGPAVLAVRVPFLLHSVSFYEGDTRAYSMPPERSVDIDTTFDVAFAEFLLQR